MFRSAHRSPGAATGLRSRRVRRLTGAAVAVGTLMLSGLISAPSASAAGWGACYRQNSWSFKHYTGSISSDIDAWHNTTCSGSSILRGRVTYNSSTRHVGIYAFDFKADGYGVTVYTHGPSVTSTGNGSAESGGGDLSSFQRPYNFWIRVGNQQNSVSQPFPSF
jgi:hypothetical protein